MLEQQHIFDAVREAVQEARSRPTLWSLDHKGWQALENGIRRVYKSGYRALAKVAAQPSAENLHEWRKQAKYLWYQMEALEPIQPKVLKKFNRQCHKLTTLLGDNHDLDVLQKTLSSNPDAFAQENGADILTLIQRRRGELQIQSFELGRLVYRESPKVFVSRLAKYWKSWDA
jgi:CHAD domain-containing protein